MAAEDALLRYFDQFLVGVSCGEGLQCRAEEIQLGQVQQVAIGVVYLLARASQPQYIEGLHVLRCAVDCLAFTCVSGAVFLGWAEIPRCHCGEGRDWRECSSLLPPGVCHRCAASSASTDWRNERYSLILSYLASELRPSSLGHHSPHWGPRFQASFRNCCRI